MKKSVATIKLWGILTTTGCPSVTVPWGNLIMPSVLVRVRSAFAPSFSASTLDLGRASNSVKRLSEESYSDGEGAGGEDI